MIKGITLCRCIWASCRISLSERIFLERKVCLRDHHDQSSDERNEQHVVHGVHSSRFRCDHYDLHDCGDVLRSCLLHSLPGSRTSNKIEAPAVQLWSLPVDELRLFKVPAYVEGENFLAVISLFLMYCWSIIPVMYPFGFRFTEPSNDYIFLIVINLFSGITSICTSFFFSRSLSWEVWVIRPRVSSLEHWRRSSRSFPVIVSEEDWLTSPITWERTLSSSTANELFA